MDNIFQVVIKITKIGNPSSFLGTFIRHSKFISKL
jgi:hypothetical protein